MKKTASLVALLLFSSGFISATDHQSAIPTSTEREMTVGIVQKEKH